MILVGMFYILDRPVRIGITAPTYVEIPKHLPRTSLNYVRMYVKYYVNNHCQIHACPKAVVISGSKRRRSLPVGPAKPRLAATTYVGKGGPAGSMGLSCLLWRSDAGPDAANQH